MSDIVIRAEGLSKRYIIGHEEEHERYATLRDVLARAARNMWRKTADMAHGRAIVPGDTTEEFWALKDLNFEIKRGDAVGIIGRNGAGKSTLLKVLSRITEPTTGRVSIEGRVASLLEVGTGFHPELTGRENIYLNGAILGMARAEIKQKFDEIVAFAGIDQFLDTPVKRYSSGMYVRLAFAVAAHLEPEILIVDEVLAVGDFEFQKKCLGKMSEVASLGRTVLFVSHNMQAVRSLCSRGILLQDGNVVLDSSAEDAVSSYLNIAGNVKTTWEDANGIGDEDAKLKAVRVYSTTADSGHFFSSDIISIEMIIEVLQTKSSLCSGFDLVGEDGGVVLRAYDTDAPDEAKKTRQPGFHRLVCEIPAGLLNGQTYGIAPRISIHNQKWIVSCDPLVEIPVVLSHGRTPYWAALTGRSRTGGVAPIFKWKSEVVPASITDADARRQPDREGDNCS